MCLHIKRKQLIIINNKNHICYFVWRGNSFLMDLVTKSAVLQSCLQLAFSEYPKFCGKYQLSTLANNFIHHSPTLVIVWPFLNFFKLSPQLDRERPEMHLLSEFFHPIFNIVPEYFHLKPCSKIFVQNFQNLFLHSIQFAMQTFNLSTIIS